MSISHEAIYQHIYRKRQSRLGKELITLLPYSYSKRRQNRKVGKNKNRISDVKRIDLRSAHIELREEIGHWESDLVIGRENKSAIATIVERKTRFVYIIGVKSKHTKIVTKAIATTMKKLHPDLRKTITHDNGTEMANHKWLTTKTGWISISQTHIHHGNAAQLRSLFRFFQPANLHRDLWNKSPQPPKLNSEHFRSGKKNSL